MYLSTSNCALSASTTGSFFKSSIFTQVVHWVIHNKLHKTHVTLNWIGTILCTILILILTCMYVWKAIDWILTIFPVNHTCKRRSWWIGSHYEVIHLREIAVDHIPCPEGLVRLFKQQTRHRWSRRNAGVGHASRTSEPETRSKLFVDAQKLVRRSHQMCKYNLSKIEEFCNCII